MEANPLVLAAIGLPFLVGIVLRVTHFNPRALELSVTVSVAVFFTIATGYLFWTFSSPTDFIVQNGRYIGVIFCFASCGLMLHDKEMEVWQGLLVGPAIFLLLWIWLPQVGWAKPSYCINVLTIFVGIGLAQALLGTIASGFTLSTVVHSLTLGHGFPNMFFWKDVFEFLHVSSAPVMIVILILVNLGSVAELLHKLAHGAFISEA